MTDTYLELAIFTVVTLVIGAVIFGGMTLTYFLERRRVAPIHARVQRLDQGARITAARDRAASPRDQAA
jgi:NhaP-type Na+/H+ or K+/H+ antiporter